MENVLRTGKYLNPFVDFGFKKLFGTEVNKIFLIDFLNQIIKEEGRIKDLQYLKTEQLGEKVNDRKAIFDIYCENEKGEKFVVEMQKVRQQYFKDRSLFYVTYPIREQSSQKDWNFKLKAIYTICILDFEFPENTEYDYFCHKVKLMDVERKNVFYDKLTFIYLEMPKFRKEEKDLHSLYDKWLYVVKNLSRLDNRPKELREKIFEDFFRVAEVAQLTTKEMDKYEEDLKNSRDLKNSLDTAKEEGFEAGLEQEKKSIAIKCLQQGMSVDTINQITDLTVEQISMLVQDKN